MDNELKVFGKKGLKHAAKCFRGRINWRSPGNIEAIEFQPVWASGNVFWSDLISNPDEVK
jgi:hypothetical protein